MVAHHISLRPVRRFFPPLRLAPDCPDCPVRLAWALSFDEMACHRCSSPDAWLPCRIGIGFGGRDRRGMVRRCSQMQMPRQRQTRPPPIAATHQQGCLGRWSVVGPRHAWRGALCRRRPLPPPARLAPHPTAVGEVCTLANPRMRDYPTPDEDGRAWAGAGFDHMSSSVCAQKNAAPRGASRTQNRSAQGCCWQAKSSGIERYRSELSAFQADLTSFPIGTLDGCIPPSSALRHHLMTGHVKPRAS